MSDGFAALRRLLTERYDELAARLARKLGSAELADEALQDTFVRLTREGPTETIRNPRAYLLRMAFNMASTRLRVEKRRMTVAEGAAFLDFVDEAPGPDRVAEGRSDFALLERALAELSPRRRDIFEAAWMREEAHQDIAARYGLSLRMIQIELKHAVEHVAGRLDEAAVLDFATRRRKTS
jgi:RNA polymerase sigma factor (sigma-70 family)